MPSGAAAVSAVDVAALAADPSRAAQAALATVTPEQGAIAVHFDVDIVDFIDAPLSEDTGRNVGVPLQAALDALATLLGDPRATALTVTELTPFTARPMAARPHASTTAWLAHARTGARATIYPALPLDGRMVSAAVRTPVSEIAVPDGPGASRPLRPRGAPLGAWGWARSYAPAASPARSNFSLGS